MSKNKQSKTTVFRSIEARTEHYLPETAAAEREAREPMEEVIQRRLEKVLGSAIRQSKARRDTPASAQLAVA